MLGQFQHILLTKSVLVHFTQETFIRDKMCVKHSQCGVCSQGIRQTPRLITADIRGGRKTADEYYVTQVISDDLKCYKENKPDNVIESD